MKFTTTKLKNLEQPKLSNINIFRQATLVKNHNHQKLLGFNVYNIPINLFKTDAPPETIHLVCPNQITGFCIIK